MEIRSKFKDKFKESHGVGLGFMSFFAKACCIALQEWPAVNAYIDGDHLVYHDYCDISIAVLYATRIDGAGNSQCGKPEHGGN
jgi:2-oxoglutarate dehydrogenase E2 component (dihydrolipoamide succinyltransferase)